MAYGFRLNIFPAGAGMRAVTNESAAVDARPRRHIDIRAVADSISQPKGANR
jgi:hypothetical protein